MYILALSESSWSTSLKIIFLFHRRMHRPLYSMRAVLDGHLFNFPASTNNNISHSARSPRGWRWQTNVWANCRFYIHLLSGFPVGTANNYDHYTFLKKSHYLLPIWRFSSRLIQRGHRISQLMNAEESAERLTFSSFMKKECEVLNMWVIYIYFVKIMNCSYVKNEDLYIVNSCE